MHISKKALFGGLAACAVVAATAGSAFAQQGNGPPPPADPTRRAQVIAALQAGRLQTGQLSEDIKSRLAGRIDAMVASGVLDGTKLAELQVLTPEQRQAKGAERLARFQQDHPGVLAPMGRPAGPPPVEMPLPPQG